MPSHDLIASSFAVLQSCCRLSSLSAQLVAARVPERLFALVALFHASPFVLRHVLETLHCLLPRAGLVPDLFRVTPECASQLARIGRTPESCDDPGVIRRFAHVCRDVVCFGRPDEDVVIELAIGVLMLLFRASAELVPLFECHAALMRALPPDSRAEILNDFWMPNRPHLDRFVRRLAGFSGEAAAAFFEYLNELCELMEPPPEFLAVFSVDMLIGVASKAEAFAPAVKFLARMIARGVVCDIRSEITDAMAAALDGESYPAREAAIEYFHAVGAALGWAKVGIDRHIRFLECDVDMVVPGMGKGVAWLLDGIEAALAGGDELVKKTLDMCGECGLVDVLEEVVREGDEGERATAILTRIAELATQMLLQPG
jgi:hypothetical protein